jgi:hypothetical protein
MNPYGKKNPLSQYAFGCPLCAHDLKNSTLFYKSNTQELSFLSEG